MVAMKISKYLVSLILPFAIGCSGMTDSVTSMAASQLGVDGAALSALQSLKGKSLVDSTGALGGGSWTIGDYGVADNPISGNGPVLSLVQGQVTKLLPVETEGDVANLVQTVTGQSSGLAGGELSTNYQTALGLLSK